VRRPHYTPSTGASEERAFLVGILLPRKRREDEEDNLRELELLARTAGASIVGSTIQSRARIDGSTFIGEGKVEELARLAYEQQVNLFIFDDDLSPAQARNIENRLKVNVVDRSELILDIFARRARTKQARIQVEIAQLKYALPRLRRLWDHLSRQAGGIGTRGPGETQLEVDRRRVRERVEKLSKELDKIDRRVKERRKQRRSMFNIAIAGYTNAGKSTLLNRLSGSKILQSPRLFSTLDSTTRKVKSPSGKTFLLTDTIGFIRKLPPHLVDSFRATLRDVREADQILHLVDVADKRYEDHIDVVNGVLGEVLGGKRADEEVPTLLVLNKIDLIGNDELKSLQGRYAEAVQISASTGDGLSALLEAVDGWIERDIVLAVVEVEAEDGRAVDTVEKIADVLDRTVEGTRMIFHVRVRKRNLAALESAGEVRVQLG
jgi:GTP-binding protein HflX